MPDHQYLFFKKLRYILPLALYPPLTYFSAIYDCAALLMDSTYSICFYHLSASNPDVVFDKNAIFFSFSKCFFFFLKKTPNLPKFIFFKAEGLFFLVT